jgi:hypothetical protein
MSVLNNRICPYSMCLLSLGLCSCYGVVPYCVDCMEVSGWVACASVGGGWEPWLARAHVRKKTGTGTPGAQGCLLTQSQAKPVSLTQPDSYSLLQSDGNKL